MHHVPEAQRRVAGEDHTRLPEVAAEVSVNAGVVFQLVGLDQLKHGEHRKCNMEAYISVPSTFTQHALGRRYKSFI